MMDVHATGTADQSPEPTSIFSGGGEMGALMRAFDWSATPVGPVEQWPQSLKTSVSTCLNSRFAILIWWGPDLVKFYNDAYKTVLGSKHPGALGARGRDVWPEIWHIIGPMLEGVLQRGEATWSDDLLLELERDGYPEECYFTFSYSPVRDESGSIAGVFTPVQETTTHVIGERRLRTLRDLAAAARGANAQTTVDQVCTAAMNILARNAHDLPFAALYLVRQDDSEAALCGVAGALPGSAAAPHVISLQDDAGPWPLARAMGSAEPALAEIPEALDVPCGAWPIRPKQAIVLPISASGQRVGFLVAAISPRKRLDEDYRDFLMLIAGHVATGIAEARAFDEERRRAEALAELDRAKTAFFSNVSHEFRTPLTLLLGPLEELLARRGGPLDAADWDQLELAHRNGLRLLRLVNNLLDFSRLEAGRLQAMYEPADLAQATADIASTFRSAVERAGLRLVIECDRLPELVYVDREMWEKIVLNLLSNAFKFTFEGQISVSLHACGKFAELQVEDTGIGIPTERLPHIFQRFYRIEGSRGRTQEGSGIGLALVQELATLHGGAVLARSAPGEGSTFTVRIPFGAKHLPPGRIGPGRPTVLAQSEAFVEEALQWLSSATPSRTLAPAGQAAGEAGRILLADDNADMREYVRRLLSEKYTVEAVADGAAALAALRENPPDLVLADVMMPGLNGFELLRSVRENPRTAPVPVILVSARAGEESRVEGLEGGADDYLVKPFTARELMARVGCNIEMSRIRRSADDRFRRLYAANIVGIVSADQEKVYDANDAFLGMIGYSREDLEASRIRWSEFTPPEYIHLDKRGIQELLSTGSCQPFEKELFRKDGTRVPILIGATLLEHSPLRWLCFVLDLTERKHLEKRLFEKQKLETIGQLAGGIAHDYNNLLAAILGNASLLHEEMPPGSPGRESLDDIIEASEQAAHLTRQMLAYSGKGQFIVERVNLAETIETVAGLTRHSIPKQVGLRLEVDRDLPAVIADGSQIKQVILNLLLNAAEAIDNGAGAITISARAHDVAPENGDGAHGEPLEPGTYVRIEVRDTGCGMDEATLARIFDPFFTTKFMGRGLGLAAAAGIVRSHRGSIQVSSAPGKGSTFVVLFPAAQDQSPHAVKSTRATAADAHTPATVLVVDDEAVVLRTATLALQRYGYAVLQAENGPAAIDMITREKERISVVILDVSMPGMSGQETLAKLRAVHPRVKVIVSSGYTEAETLRSFAGQTPPGFLQKPYTAARLAEKVKETLRGE